MKKLISLLLALLMAFSLALPTFAVCEENQKLTEAEVQDALSTAVAALVYAPEDADVIVDEDRIPAVFITTLGDTVTGFINFILSIIG